MPNDDGHPPAFGKRAATSHTSGVDEEHLKQLLAQATERGLGQFELRNTLLLPQDGPAPETREQYMRDLADSIRWATWEELGIFQSPVELPEAMAAHRQQLMDEYAGDVLRARACFPAVGHLWIKDSLKQLEQALEEVNTRAEAVMSYELARLEPADVGPARPFLEKRLQALIEETKTTYTADGLAALRLLYDDLRQPPWEGLDSLLAEERAEVEDEDTTVDH